VRLVQLRIKDASPYALVHEIRAALAYAGDAGATLIVNDHWQLALELGAHGVHLGQEDLAGVDIAGLRSSGMLLGVSTHSYWEVCRARALQPSYIACGPVHATQLKRMPWTPQGDGNVAYWSALLGPTPVVAIGGMDAPRARAAMAAGASAVAVVGAITRSADPEAAIAELRAAVEAGANARLQGPAPSWARSTLVA
jgi:thiamine-phosphate diphosphorylase